MKYICDTNFIIRYLLADNQVMFTRTKEIFDKAKIGQVTLTIEQTVFTEVIFVLSSFYQVPKDKIVETLAELVTYKGIDSDIDTMLSALYIYRDQNLHIVDCLLLVKSKLTKVPILSFDRKPNAKFATL